MKLLIKQAHIVDPRSSFNGQTADILIENGTISAIGNLAEQADQTIDEPGLHVSPGWLDIFSNFNDPGFEHKETLETGADAAIRGGFTDVMVLPNTQPVVHSKSQVEYIRQKSTALGITIHPIGAVTKNAAGKELAEMYDMKASGAVAFSDGIQSIQSAGLLVKALQYIKAFDGVIIQVPNDETINPHGLMHEGIISTQLGLPGKPAIAEELMIERDIHLAQYAGSKIHITGISSAKSLDYIKAAKKTGIQVSCSVTPHHLFFCDEDLQQYDTNLKLNPPLRLSADREALQTAVKEGWIDCIASHHQPQERDAKMVEFEYAANGIAGIETVYAVIMTALPGISQQRVVEMLSINPAEIFGLTRPVIREGEQACLTFFNPRKKWTPVAAGLASKSKNSPYIGKELNGKVEGIYNKGRLHLIK